MTEPEIEPAAVNAPVSTGRRVAELVVLCVVLGVLVGVVWSVIAPTTQFEVTRDGVAYRSGFPGEYIAADGWFAVLAAVAGLVVAGFVLVRGRGRFDVPVVVAVAVTGVLGSLLAWWIGHELGPDRPRFTGNEPVGTILTGQLTLGARGVLFVWSILAIGVLMFVLAWQRPDDEPDASVAGDEQTSVGGDRQVGQVDGGQ